MARTEMISNAVQRAPELMKKVAVSEPGRVAGISTLVFAWFIGYQAVDNFIERRSQKREEKRSSAEIPIYSSSTD